MIAPDQVQKLLQYVDIVGLADELCGGESRREGRRYRRSCWVHSERNGSMVLYPDQASFHCYGCGHHGDAIKLVQDRQGLDFLDAMRFLAQRTGFWPDGLTDRDGKPVEKRDPPPLPEPRNKPDKRLRWQVITPVPSKVPEPRLGTFEAYLHQAGRNVMPSKLWIYRDAAGQILGCDVRYDFDRKPKDDLYQVGDSVRIWEDGREGLHGVVTAVSGSQVTLANGHTYPVDQLSLQTKAVITYTWCRSIDTGEERWKQKSWDEPSPLYGLDQLAQRPDAEVIITEGCKAAEAAARLFPTAVAVTWRGGCASAADFDRNDWSPLAGRKVTIWPDADDVGRVAAWNIAQHLRQVGASSVHVVDTAGLPKGWDLADQDKAPIGYRGRMLDAAVADQAWIDDHDQDLIEEQAQIESQMQTGPEDAPPPEDDDEGLRNELADAARLVADITGKAWYCPQRGSTRRGDLEAGWLVWDGKRLCPSDGGQILLLGKKTAKAMGREYQAAADLAKTELDAIDPKEDREAYRSAKQKVARLLSKADQIQSEKRIRTMISLASIEPRIQIHQRELDADPDLLNVQNGVVHLPTATLFPHDPKYRCTRITAVPYLPDADATALMCVLHRSCMVQDATNAWVVDEDRIRYLQDAVGHAIYGHSRLQQFYLCLGKGRDGKGTLFEALLDALGGGCEGYAMKADMQSFVRQKLTGHRIRDDLANMAGARLVLAAEINKGEALDAALIKTLSGEDTQRVRHLFGKEFEFRPICTIFLQSNHKPWVESQDSAIWERLVQIPFGPPLRPDERDPGVRKALHDPVTGGAALLAWAIAGAKRTYECKRLTPTDSVQKATEAYRSEMNPLGGFFLEDLRFAPDERAKETWVAMAAMQQALAEWQQRSGIAEERKGCGISGRVIGQHLRDCGAWPHTKKVDGKVVKFWLGVTLRHDHPLFPDHCPGSYVPSEEDHKNHLATHGETIIVTPDGNQVTSVTSKCIDAHTREKKLYGGGVENTRGGGEKCSRAFSENAHEHFSAPVRDNSTSSGYPGYLSENKERKEEDNNKRETDLPDLDDGLPF